MYVISYKVSYQEKWKINVRSYYVKCYNLRVLQRSPWYPATHPVIHIPLILEHFLMLRQCPHVSLQLSPNDPSSQAGESKKISRWFYFRYIILCLATDKLKIYIRVKIVIQNIHYYKYTQCMYIFFITILAIISPPSGVTARITYTIDIVTTITGVVTSLSTIWSKKSVWASW